MLSQNDCCVTYGVLTWLQSTKDPFCCLEDLPASKPEQMALMDTRGVQEGEPGKQGAVPCGTADEMKEQMKQFTESVHQKASSVVSWISQLEGGPVENSRLQKLLDLYSNGGFPKSDTPKSSILSNFPS